MSGTTTELALATAVDSDDNADYLTISLANSLRTVDALFNNVTGHVHNGAHQGGPITSIPISAIPDGSITSAKIADGTIAAVDLNAALGNFGAGAVWTPTVTQGAATPTFTTSQATYFQIGKLVNLMLSLTMSAVGSINNDIVVGGLPVAPRSTSGFACLGSFVYVRSGIGIYAGSVVASSTTQLRLVSGGGDVANNISGNLGNVNGPAFAIAINDVVSLNLHYEAA